MGLGHDPEQSLEIIETLRHRLTGLGARGGIAHEKDADLLALPLHQRPGEAEPIVAALRPVRGIVEDDERFQRLPAGRLVRGSSGAFTYVMLHGPTLCSWNVTPSDPAHAECTILAGIAAKLPALSAVPPE